MRQYACYLEWFSLTSPNQDAGAFHHLFEAQAAPDLEELMADLDVARSKDDAQLCGKHLHLAAQHGQVLVAHALLLGGASPDGVTTKHNRVATPLSIAIAHQHGHELVGLLLDRGANPNLSNTNLVNSVHVAAMQPDVWRLRVLLDTGRAALDPRDINRWTPLMFAAWNGRLEALQLLVARG